MGDEQQELWELREMEYKNWCDLCETWVKKFDYISHLIDVHGEIEEENA